MTWFKKKKRDPLGDAGMVMSASIKVDFDFQEFASRHIFNKVSGASEYGFYYSPYGYFFRYPKWGNINDFGFRGRENPDEIRQRYPDHFVICVFGGSTGYSILLPDELTFAQQLEVRLNRNDAFRDLAGKPCRVVNLSHPGNMLLNQIFNYVLFCHLIKPDLVISHFGANDIATAQMNDRRLVSRYDLSYCDVLEVWGRKIHDCTDVDVDYDFARPDNPNFRPAEVRNGPEIVLRSMDNRVTQFAALVRGEGRRFIGGFQPWVYSKGSPSEAEQQKMRSYNPFYQRVYGNAKSLCDMYSERLAAKPRPGFIDLHTRFAELDGSVTHFGDVCHTVAAGDTLLAAHYEEQVLVELSVKG